MPTIRGWALIGAGVALVLLWAILGNDPELLLAGTFLTTAGLIGVAWVRITGLRLTASRHLSPAAVHDGDTTSASITINNIGRFRIAQLLVVDEVQGLGSAAFEIARLRAGASATGTYRVSCRPRGVYPVGPSTVTATDPLGLAEITAAASAVDRLVVYPALEKLEGLPSLAGRQSQSANSVPDRSHKGGEDFYTLRPYQQGDDLRRVHWPWSAKTDELMIRQLETPQQANALVFLDTRAGAYETTDDFERAVIGAASAFAHLVTSGLATEFWSGGGLSGGEASFLGAMEQLAVVSPEHGIDLSAASRQMRNVQAEGALILVTGRADRDAISLIGALASETSVSIAMVSALGSPGPLAEFHRRGVSTVVSSSDATWSESWRRAVEGSWDAVSAT